MSERDADEEQLLAQARRAWSASPADAERVLRATQLAIAGAPAAHGGEGAAHAAPAAPSAAAGLASKWLAVTAVAVLGAGSGGYLLGYRAGREVSHREAAARVAAATTPVERPAPPIATVVPVQPTAADAQVGTAEPPGIRSAAPQVAAVPAAWQPSAAKSDPDLPPSLAAETRALRRVERALREGRPELALRLLATLERTAAHPVLAEERFAAWTLARCAQLPDVERSREFSARYPGSVYRSRVERACLGEGQEP